MSVLAPPAVTNTPATIQAVTTITPSREHIILAGEVDPVSTPHMDGHVQPTVSAVRAHLAPGEITSVHSFTEVVPTPQALGERPTTEQLEAAQELSHYARDLCTPIECVRTSNGSFESDTTFSNAISVETMEQNMRKYNLCLKTTISSESPHFTPSVYRVDADDLQKLSTSNGIVEGGLISKFIQAKCDSVPHHILMHFTQDNTQSAHRFYGIAFVQKDRFTELHL